MFDQFCRIIEDVRKISQGNSDKIIKLIGNKSILHIANLYIQHSNRKVDIGLNLFTLISSQYQKENLHSDILKLILSPKGQHKEGDKFLMLFMEYLQKCYKNVLIDTKDYQHVIVKREEGRIDISILDEFSKKAIIIENKINGASDMYRQIPRYIEYLEKKGYNINAVIYLTLSEHKMPDTYGWNNFESIEIIKRILPVCFYDESINDLYSGWLLKCEANAEYVDTFFLLKQYNKLIQHIV